MSELVKHTLLLLRILAVESIIPYYNNMDVNITKIRTKFIHNFAFLYFCGSAFSYFCENAKMRKYEIAISSIRILIIKSNIMQLLEVRIA